MKQLSSFKLTEKKSKFFAYLYKVTDEDNIKQVISLIKKQHLKANHVCYGLIINEEERFKNDGEVGHPGRALLDTLKENKLNSHILIVARYFGGIKLGPGGVSRAFRSAGRSCCSSRNN